MDEIAIFCADVGSVRRGRFGWAFKSLPRVSIDDRNGSSPADLAEAVAEQLLLRRPVALGFECPLFVPVPSSPDQLGAARSGEGNRAWSAGAGCGAMATGLVQASWVLSSVRERCPSTALHLEWEPFASAKTGLFIWEAFVSNTAKGATHVDDATIAIEAFVNALPNPNTASTVTAERPLSLAGAAALWSGWLKDTAALRTPVVVIKA